MEKRREGINAGVNGTLCHSKTFLRHFVMLRIIRGKTEMYFVECTSICRFVAYNNYVSLKMQMPIFICRKSDHMFVT